MAAEGEYKVVTEGGSKVLKINYENSIFTPSIEDDSSIMSRVFDILLEIGKVTKISFLQREEYAYEYDQVKLILELIDIYNNLVKEQNLLSFGASGAKTECQRFIPAWRNFLSTNIMQGIKEDPIGAYVNLVRRRREEEARLKVPPIPEYAECVPVFIDALTKAISAFENTRLIKLAIPYLPGFKPGDRTIYRKFFKPNIRPFFMYTKLVTAYPAGAEEVEAYKIAEDTEVLILKVPWDIRMLYHIIPPEFRLTEEKYSLLTAAREVMAEHRPERSEFANPARTREIFLSIGRDLLSDLAKSKGIKLSYDEFEELARILVRYTIGFGLVEILLADDKIQDLVVNAPLGTTPISIIHADYGECKTNVTPLPHEGESWATKLRLISGRPLDEANPVLDSDLSLPHARARVAALQSPLSPFGYSFAFRRHRDKSWTLPLFIQAGMLTPLAAGLISFLIDGARTILVAGTRSSGKTSILGAMLVELARNNRVITSEDSVTGDCQILVKRNGVMEKTKVSGLIDNLIMKYGFENKSDREVLKHIPEKIEVLTSDIKGKIKFATASAFIRHKVEKPIYQITTATGRRIKVTGDHSLFSIGNETVFEEVKVNELGPGDFIATPRILPIQNEAKKQINLLEHSDELEDIFAVGPQVKSLVEQRWAEIKRLAKLSYSRSMPAAWKRNSILPLKILGKIDYNLDPSSIKLKGKANSKTLPALLELDEDFLTFIGLWLADGCYDKDAVIISACEPEEREIVQKVATKLGLSVRLHSDDFSLMLCSKVLQDIMQNVLDLNGNAYTKKIPNWIYQLSQDQVACVLRGVFSGDGCAADKEVILASASQELLKDLQTLLLNFGIILRVRQTQRPDKTYNSSISALKFLRLFKDKIGFVQKSKTQKLEKLCLKISTHDSTDIIPLSIKAKCELADITCLNKDDYLRKNYNIGREHMSNLLEGATGAPNPIKYLAKSDIFWDRVIEIKKLNSKDIYVYDISVPETENFVCENFIAHNTLELPVAQLRSLGYDILSMKTRSVITGAESEVEASQAIRTALRLGDSALIIGEIRSVEALALFEAMRVGALAKVVAGTIHGDSPYSVFDRVVNDLKVPKTSFKATDIIMVANTITSPSGLERYRRLTEIAEVRKFWTDDPLLEKGFADLMTYDAVKDTISATDVLLEGESEIIKAIGNRVREWSGNWDAIWNNIELRAKIKQALVDTAQKTGDSNLLEAGFVVKSNDEFHRLSSLVAEEVGFTDPKRVYSEWESWLKSELKRRAKEGV